MAPVRFGYGSVVERFERFGLSVPVALLGKGFPVFDVSTDDQRVRNGKAA